MAADRVRGRHGVRVSQSYFRSPTFLQLATCDRYLDADGRQAETAVALDEGDGPHMQGPIHAADATQLSAGRHSLGPADALDSPDGIGDSATALKRPRSLQSAQWTSLPSLSSLRSSPTLLGFTRYRGVAPPFVASSPPPSGEAAYGRRPPNRRAVSQSLVEAWDLAQRAGSGGGVQALAERLRVAERVQRAIDAADGDRQAAAAAAADRTPPLLLLPRRRLAGSSERGAALSEAPRHELKYKNIFFNVGGAPHPPTAASCLLAGVGDQGDRLRNSSAAGGVGAKKRVRFMDAMSWEAPTQTA